MKYFSEREGYKKDLSKMQDKNLDKAVRNRLWNAFLKCRGYDNFSDINFPFNSDIYEDICNLGDKFFKLNIGLFRGKDYSKCLNILESKFDDLKWYEVYDFLEFVYKESDSLTTKNNKKEWEGQINSIFKSENLSYRFIKGMVTPITNKEEIKEIEKALKSSDKFKPAREHIEKALKLFSDRKNPDYENSIKEAISALESLSKIILNSDDESFKSLINKMSLHPALKSGLIKLYGWTSDENGIRHGSKGDKEDKNLIDEARFMLVFCFACFNYLISKYGD